MREKFYATTGINERTHSIHEQMGLREPEFVIPEGITFYRERASRRVFLSFYLLHPVVVR